MPQVLLLLYKSESKGSCIFIAVITQIRAFSLNLGTPMRISKQLNTPYIFSNGIRIYKKTFSKFLRKTLGSDLNSSSGPVLDKLRKNIIALFRNERLSVSIETILLQTDFLDVTFSLETGKFLSFRKPNTYQPLHIKTEFNQPPTILRSLPNIINKRLSDLSCNEEEY